MKDKTSKDITSVLKTLNAPSPSEALKTRILEGARNTNHLVHPDTSQAANDNKWKWASGIAAILIATVMLGATLWFEPTSTSETSDMWAEAAMSIGYDDLYEWVYDTEIEDSL